MRCATCGAVNPDQEAAFCAFCGAGIERHGSAEEEFTVDCPSCAVLNPWDAKFCLDCGEPIPEESERRGAPAFLPFGGAAAAGGAAGGIGAVLSGLGGGEATVLSGAASAASEGLAGAASGAESLAGAGSSVSEAISGAAGTPGIPDVPLAQASPPLTPQAPPPPPPPAAPPPPPAAAESVTSGAKVASETAKGANRFGRIVRGGALVTTGIGGIAALLAIIGGILALTGDPAPCVDRRSTASTGAALNANARWEAFKAAGPGASVTFTEEEITSQGVAYLQDRGSSISGLQVYFCPDGKAEAKGRVSFLGRDLNVLFRGTLDVSGGQNRLVVDSVKAGNLPSQVGTRIVEQLLDRNNVRDLPLGIVLASSASIDGSHMLKR